MSVEPGFAEKVLLVSRAFDAAEVSFAFGGAISLNYYTEPRATIDLDINLFCGATEFYRVAEVLGGIASVTMRFVSELITATHDRSGTVVGGDPQRVSEVTDVWTFVRDVSTAKALQDVNWKLDETQPPN